VQNKAENKAWTEWRLFCGGEWQYARRFSDERASGTDVTLLDTLARVDKDSGLGRTDESIQIRDSSAERVFLITFPPNKISLHLLLIMSSFVTAVCVFGQ